VGMIRIRKILFLLICFVAISGFTVKDNFDVEKYKIIENIEVKMSKSELESELNNPESDSFILTAYYGNPAYFFDGNRTKGYDKSIDENSGYYVINLKAEYNFNEFEHSVFPELCFNTFNYKNNSNKLELSLEGFRCTEAANIEVIVNSAYKVIENNADEVNENKLIWNFSTDTNEKSIRLNLSDKLYRTKTELQGMVLFIIIGFVVVVGVFVAIIKSKKNNAI
jgi:hypothetical protein